MIDFLCRKIYTEKCNHVYIYVNASIEGREEVELILQGNPCFCQIMHTADPINAPQEIRREIE